MTREYAPSTFARRGHSEGYDVGPTGEPRSISDLPRLVVSVRNVARRPAALRSSACLVFVAGRGFPRKSSRCSIAQRPRVRRQAVRERGIPPARIASTASSTKSWAVHHCTGPTVATRRSEARLARPAWPVDGEWASAVAEQSPGPDLSCRSGGHLASLPPSAVCGSGPRMAASSQKISAPQPSRTCSRAGIEESGAATAARSSGPPRPRGARAGTTRRAPRPAAGRPRSRRLPDRWARRRRAGSRAGA